MIFLNATFLLFGVVFAGNGDEIALAFIGFTVGGVLLRILLHQGLSFIFNLFRRK